MTSSGSIQEVDHERLRDLIHNSLSAEFVSIRNRKPVIYPLTPFYDDETQRVVVSSPPAFAGKIENVRNDSRVAVLLHGDDDEYVVIGDGHVREGDPEMNAEYIRNRIRNEPETHKRATFEETIEFLESWIGEKLMGWYELRLVVEFDPISVIHTADSSSIDELPAWEGIGMNEKEANRHERAVLSIIRDDGYPLMHPITSLRLQDGGAILEPDPTERLREGQPACLLLHWHDNKLQYLGQRVVRGRFRTSENSLKFVPGSSSKLTIDGILSMLRFIINGRHQTKAYFQN